jgi:hypothetical protein
MVKIKEFKSITKDFDCAGENIGRLVEKTATELANEYLTTISDADIIDIKYVSTDEVVVVHKESTKDPFFTFSSESLIEELTRRNFFLDYWTEDDILQCAENSELSIRKSEIPSIYKIMYDKLDSNKGINWDFIAKCITIYVEKRDNPPSIGRIW